MATAEASPEISKFFLQAVTPHFTSNIYIHIYIYIFYLYILYISHILLIYMYDIYNI